MIFAAGDGLNVQMVHLCRSESGGLLLSRINREQVFRKEKNFSFIDGTDELTEFKLNG